MRLLLVNYEYPPLGGGAATATFHLARALRSLGHDPLVLTAGFGSLRGLSCEEGVRVFRCRARRRRPDRSDAGEMLSFVLAAGRALPGLIRREKPDGCLVFFSFPCGPLGLLARFLARVPYVISLRGGDVPGAEKDLNALHCFLRPLRRLIFRRSIAVVANSPALKAMSEAADPHPVSVIPNGVDAHFFRPETAVTPPPSGAPFPFLFVGRFRKEKNVPFLLEQMALLRRRSNVPFLLHLVGDGPQEGLLKAGIGGEIAGIVRWHGWLRREAVLPLYREGRCLLNPSLHEGMPNVVLEAMACGLPVIASDVPGNDAVVRHGETGFLFPLENPHAFQTALDALLADPALARRMGCAGRAWVERDFSWEASARSYLRLFEGPQSAG